MENLVGIVAVVLMAILGPAIICFLPLWGLWNWVGINVLQLAPISALESFGLMLLVSCILFPASGWASAKIR